MGIELSYGQGYNARCDSCDSFTTIGATNPGSAMVQLRDQGWVRKDYIETAHHYVWYCPKCFYKD